MLEITFMYIKCTIIIATFFSLLSQINDSMKLEKYKFLGESFNGMLHDTYKKYPDFINSTLMNFFCIWLFLFIPFCNHLETIYKGNELNLIFEINDDYTLIPFIISIVAMFFYRLYKKKDNLGTWWSVDFRNNKVGYVTFVALKKERGKQFYIVRFDDLIQTADWGMFKGRSYHHSYFCKIPMEEINKTYFKNKTDAVQALTN